LYPKAKLMHPPGKSQFLSDDRWVVVHDAERDHYELPVALAEVGALERFVTDWYTGLDRPFWQHLANTRLGKSTFGISKRYRVELPSRLTIDNKVGFAAGLIRRKLTNRPSLDQVVGGNTGRTAASIANRHGCHLLAASYCAATAFENLRPGLKRVLFQVHPHPRFLRSLYKAKMEEDADYASLIHEAETAVSEPELVQWEQESKLADHILCASNFTRRSLEVSGVAADKISVVPYGVHTELFQYGRPSGDGPLKVLYVGQKVARKGLRMLLRVWQQLQPVNAHLVLAGGHVRDESVLHGFENLYTETPRIGNADLVRLFQQADIFVLPSLAEGFGHVYLEALACGVPIICTDNTGGADIIRHGESGWILPAGDPVALADCLSWTLAHRRHLREMREAARAVAEQYSWSRFREGIREVLLAATAETEQCSSEGREAGYEEAVAIKDYA
jgi:glycosyltransferase involved in cell wall biosynthesis